MIFKAALFLGGMTPFFIGRGKAGLVLGRGPRKTEAKQQFTSEGNSP